MHQLSLRSKERHLSLPQASSLIPLEDSGNCTEDYLAVRYFASHIMLLLEIVTVLVTAPSPWLWPPLAVSLLGAPIFPKQRVIFL